MQISDDNVHCEYAHYHRTTIFLQGQGQLPPINYHGTKQVPMKSVQKEIIKRKRKQDSLPKRKGNEDN